MKKIRVGTRKSHLAQLQTDKVMDQLIEIYREVHFEKVLIETSGDLDQKTDLIQMGGQGVFVKRLQDALLNDEIDIAVHSAKDMPSVEPSGLTIAAFPERKDVFDCLLTTKPITEVRQLAEGAVIGTSSTRRRFQLQTLRPDLKILPLRGNIDTRVKKLQNGQYDGILMAQAALERYQMPLAEMGIYQLTLPLSDFLPAVGQGAIAVETKTDTFAEQMVASIDDALTREAVTCERAFLAYFGLGCNVPLAAYAKRSGDKIQLQAMLGDETTGQLYSTSGEGIKPEILGKRIAQLLDQTTN